jgi:hypothetical protein
MQMSSNTIKYNAHDNLNNDLSLLDFYNNIFSQQIKGILLDQYAGKKFLLSPFKQ